MLNHTTKQIILLICLLLSSNVLANSVERKFIAAGLIDVNTIVSSIKVDLVNSDPRKNFFEADFYGGLNIAYLRRSIAVMLSKAQGIQSNLRAGDTVARMGGDEFVLVLVNYHSADDLAHAVQRVLDTIAMPIQIGNVQVNVTASIGVTSVPPDEHDAELLIRHADQAMYNAKASGKNRYHVFTPED